MVGTIWTYNGKDVKKAGHTTPESSDLQRELAQMVSNGCVCCVMEISSQGIKMQRVEGIFFDIGVFLNIEPDHIGPGEHASLQSICTVKAGCFGSVRQELSTVMTGIRKNTVWSYL